MDFKNLTEEQFQKMATEHALFQSMCSTTPTRSTLFLPHFSGDGKGCDYGYWKESVKSLQSLNHDNNAILQAIRKSISGTAAKVIGCLPFSSTIDKIIEGLDVSFGELKNDTANWQMFYNARQMKTESIIDWNVRLRDLWKKAPTATVSDTETDKIIKAQLWIGLKSIDVKNASRHFNDNNDKSSSDLLLYIRRLEDTTLLQQQPGKLVLPVSSDGATEEVSALRQELAEMKVMMMQQQRDKSNQRGHKQYSQQPNNQKQVYNQQPNSQHQAYNQQSNGQQQLYNQQSNVQQQSYNQQPQHLQQQRPPTYSCFRCGKLGHVMKYCRSVVEQQHHPRQLWSHPRQQWGQSRQYRQPSQWQNSNQWQQTNQQHDLSNARANQRQHHFSNAQTSQQHHHLGNTHANQQLHYLNNSASTQDPRAMQGNEMA